MAAKIYYFQLHNTNEGIIFQSKVKRLNIKTLEAN